MRKIKRKDLADVLNQLINEEVFDDPDKMKILEEIFKDFTKTKTLSRTHSPVVKTGFSFTQMHPREEGNPYGDIQLRW